VYGINNCLISPSKKRGLVFKKTPQKGGVIKPVSCLHWASTY